MDTVLGDDADNKYLHDLKGRVFASRRGKLGPAHIGHGGNRTGAGVVLGGIDAVDGILRIAVKQSDEPFDLFPGIAEQIGADLDLDLMGSPKSLARQLDGKSIKGKMVNVKKVSANELFVQLGK